MTIPDACTCLWCGGQMLRRGATTLYSSSGDMFALWCQECGAVALHRRVSGKRICQITSEIETEDMPNQRDVIGLQERRDKCR